MLITRSPLSAVLNYTAIHWADEDERVVPSLAGCYLEVLRNPDSIYFALRTPVILLHLDPRHFVAIGYLYTVVRFIAVSS